MYLLQIQSLHSRAPSSSSRYRAGGSNTPSSSSSLVKSAGGEESKVSMICLCSVTEMKARGTCSRVGGSQRQRAREEGGSVLVARRQLLKKLIRVYCAFVYI